MSNYLMKNKCHKTLLNNTNPTQTLFTIKANGKITLVLNLAIMSRSVFKQPQCILRAYILCR